MVLSREEYRMTCWAFVGCAAEWSAEDLSHVWARVDPPPSDMQDKGRGPASYPTPYYPAPGICFVPVRHRLPRTPACWGRELGTQGGGSLHSDFASSTSPCVPSTCESGGTVGRESFGHFRVFSFSVSQWHRCRCTWASPTTSWLAALAFPTVRYQVCRPPPKTAHPGARHI